MDANELRLCLGCMNELEADGTCSHCSYGGSTSRIQPYLAPGTTLDDRYLVGRLLTYNGEGASYISYDNVAHEKVVIREYFPDTFCTRSRSSDSVTVNPDCLAKYKTYMSEFAEVNKTLSRLRTLQHIQPAIDLFSQNNTTYAVYPYVEGLSLKKFLQSNSGRLSWEQVKKMFPPVFTTLSLAHNAGVIHRGISPENILVTTKGELKICGFCISAIRTSNSELTPELYSGYAAPEQYSSLEWQGSWTDVYAISAVLYRILTGCVPTEAYRRIGNDDLIEPIKINSDIPAGISHIIMKGMAVRSEDRIQTITELVTRLFEQPQYIEHEKGATQTIPVQRPGSAYDDDDEEETASEENDKAKTVAIVLLASVLVILAIILLVIMLSGGDDDTGNDPSSYNTTPIIYTTTTQQDTTTVTTTEPEVSQTPQVTTADFGEGSIVPNLVGYFYDSVKDTIATSFTIKIIEDYDNLAFAKGYITHQSIDAGIEYNPENMPELEISISMGPSLVEVPQYKGVGKDAYIAKLDEAGIQYEIKTQYSNYVKKNVVCLTSIVPGETINVKEKEVLTVTVSLGIDPATTTTTEEVTTTAPEETTAAEVTDPEPQPEVTDAGAEVGDRPLNPEEIG